MPTLPANVVSGLKEQSSKATHQRRRSTDSVVVRSYNALNVAELSGRLPTRSIGCNRAKHVRNQVFLRTNPMRYLRFKLGPKGGAQDVPNRLSETAGLVKQLMIR